MNKLSWSKKNCRGAEDACCSQDANGCPCARLVVMAEKKPCACGTEGCTDIPELTPEQLAKAKPLHPKAEKPRVVEKGPHRTVPIWPI